MNENLWGILPWAIVLTLIGLVATFIVAAVCGDEEALAKAFSGFIELVQYSVGGIVVGLAAFWVLSILLGLVSTALGFLMHLLAVPALVVLWLCIIVGFVLCVIGTVLNIRDHVRAAYAAIRRTRASRQH